MYNEYGDFFRIFFSVTTWNDQQDGVVAEGSVQPTGFTEPGIGICFSRFEVLQVLWLTSLEYNVHKMH